MNLKTVKRNLLSNPSRLNAAEVIARVAKTHLGRSAQFFLNKVMAAQVIDRLYKKALPEEWSNLKELNAVQRCRRISDIINAVYFHFDEYVLQDWCWQAAHGEMDIELIDIPIAIYGHNGRIYEEAFEDLAIDDQIIFTLEGDYYGRDNQSEEYFNALQQIHGVSESCRNIVKRFLAKKYHYHDRYTILEEAFSEKKNPSKYFPLAFRAFHLSTDNLFFDWDEETQMQSGETFTWDNDTMLWLKAEHEKAVPIGRDIGRLNKWLVANPKKNIEYIFKMIGRVIDERRRKPKQIRVRTLVDVLSGSDT